jgi:hypothetical protein
MVEVTGDVMTCGNTVTGKNYASTYYQKRCLFVTNRGKMKDLGKVRKV